MAALGVEALKRLLVSAGYFDRDIQGPMQKFAQGKTLGLVPKHLNEVRHGCVFSSQGLDFRGTRQSRVPRAIEIPTPHATIVVREIT
jgi:hypothetical protein